MSHGRLPRMRRQMFSALIATLCTAMLLAPWGAGASAQEGGERIRSFGVEITVLADGSIEIVETITYDFGDLERRGILRDIPTRLRYDDTFDRLYPLTLLEVASPTGAPAISREEYADGYTTIRVGDPDITISGVHTYVIRYRVEGALNGFATHDELYWNATGHDWDVPIDRVLVEVVTPVTIGEVLCFAGPTGSTRQCDGHAALHRQATFTHASLGPREGLTVVVGFQPGVVATPTPILEERWSLDRAFAVTPLTVGATGGLSLLVSFGIARLLWVVGRDRRWRGSVIDARFGSPTGDVERVPLFAGGPFPVEYSPPGNLRPGLIGTLRDEVAHPLDVTATIIDLATRHYLRIEEVTTAGILRDKTDWKLVRLPPPTHNGLESYERILLDAIFEDGSEVELSSLRRKFRARLENVQAALYGEVVARGWYRRSPQATRNRWLGVGVISLMGSIILFGATVARTEWGLVPIPLIIGALAIIAGHRSTPARTAAGSAVLSQVRGFERFIGSAELYRARFAEQARVFYDYLPYAVVFGLTDEWAKAFAGLSDLPEADWYVGRSLALAALADNITRFSQEASGVIAATPASSGSSGFGGGGFSGGGGGGGGGSSW